MQQQTNSNSDSANTSTGSASQDNSSENPDNSSENSGESAVQEGKNIVNQQEQNKSVNQEEFISDAAANTHLGNSMKDGLPTENGDETPTIDSDDNINRAIKKD